jgi:hypothetical protein
VPHGKLIFGKFAQWKFIFALVVEHAQTGRLARPVSSHQKR